MTFSNEQMQATEALISHQFAALQNSLVTQLEGINTSITTLEGTASQNQRDIQGVHEYLNSHPPHIATTPVVVSPVTPVSSSLRLKNPATFTGNVASACALFFAHLSLCFLADPVQFTNDDPKILFEASNMADLAFAYVQPSISELNRPAEQRATFLSSYQNFKDDIVAAFGDPNPVVDAEMSLRALK